MWGEKSKSVKFLNVLKLSAENKNNKVFYVKPIVDTQNIKIKESKHPVTSHQTTKEGSKRGSKE